MMIRKIAQHALITLTGLTLSGPILAQCVYIADCELVWSDEFDGTSVDTNKWEFMIGDGSSYGIPGWGNNELQYYRSQNATVANGELTITAKQESFGGKQYTSARLRTLNKGDWTYGRMEMRAKLPITQGMWPAFWMLASNSPYGGWAASGEIDIMESIGSNPEQIYGSIHYGGEYPQNAYSGNTTNLAPGTATDWHVYAVEWQEGIIRWFVDGELYSTKTDWYSTNGPFPAPFNVNFHLLLNLAVGGYFPGYPDGSTVFPQNYIIDYVRVYQESVAPPTGQDIVFDDMEHGDPFNNGWFEFFGGGSGTIEPNVADLPPSNSGAVSLETGWASGGTPGYFGGFGRTNPMDISGLTHFSFWINPDAGQDYNLEVNIQDDDNGDGQITPGRDDEFQYVCRVSPTGPCAISGGGWQLVEIPISSFLPDNSYLYGGNYILDTVPTGQGGNGQLINMVIAIISNTGAPVSFRTDYWLFENQTAVIPAVVDVEGGALHPHHNDENVSPYLDDVVPVVVFGASTLVGDPEDIDTDLIDAATLKFGPGMGGISPSHPPQYDVDVDSDGIDDARFRFLMSDTGFTCSDDSGTLVGGLTTGETFEGSDSFDSDCNGQCHN